MKFARINLLLMVTSASLAWANWQVRRDQSLAVPPNPQKATDVSESISAGNPQSPPAAVSVEKAVTIPETHAVSKPKFNWVNVETADYKQYVVRLREVGFPEELIRTIVIADINTLYDARETALKPKLIPHDAPPSERQTHNISDDDWQQIKALQNLRVEKQAALKEILGIYVPREILRTPISRNYEAYEYAISLMPEEKRNAVQLAQETEIFTEGFNKTRITDRAAELESFKRTCEERDAALRSVLTPEEFERYQMNTTPAGTELARRIIGMDPTDDEFTAMFRIAYKNWLETGGIYGRWRARPVPPDQIAVADQQMNASMKEILGPDRYLDYKMAISGTGQQLRNMAARYDLSREVVSQAFALQNEIDALARLPGVLLMTGADSSVAPTGDSASRLARLREQLLQVFGPELLRAWEDGRNRPVDLSP
jgi:hypothetical protein